MIKYCVCYKSTSELTVVSNKSPWTHTHTYTSTHTYINTPTYTHARTHMSILFNLSYASNKCDH